MKRVRGKTRADDRKDPSMDIDSALCVAGAVCAVGFSAAGSAIGIGKAACAAIGAWKKCYAQNKQAPYILFSYVGAPLTQTLYGMILMFVILGLVGNCIPGAGVAAVILGIFAGVGIGASAAMQGQAAAGAADSQAETGKGLANNMAALGVVETVAIFVMVFAMIAIGSLKPAKAEAEAAEPPAVEQAAEAADAPAEAPAAAEAALQ